MNKIKVLHLLIGDMDCGGIENALMQIYRNINNKEFQFDFVVHKKTENFYEREINDLGGCLYRIPHFSKKPYNHIRDLIKILKKNPDYMIIHIHTTYAIIYIDAYIAKKINRKIIIHSHNSGANKKRTFLHRLLKKPFEKLADKKIACSDLAAKWMFNNIDDVIYWKNPIELKKFIYDKKIREKIRLNEDVGNQLIILNVGRLSYQKNQCFLLELMAEILKKTDAILWLIGDGEDKKQLLEISKNLGISEKIKFLGIKKNVNEYLMAADIFVFPSLYEGLPLSLIEAQVSGINIVASNAITKDVNFSNNIIMMDLEKDSKEVWAENTIKFSKEKRNNEAYSIAEGLGFSIESRILMLENIYKEIIKKER